MCNFLSAVYLKTGKLLCEPQYTDSHSELLKAFGIAERETTAPVQPFVRLELTPPDGKFDGATFLAFDKWTEKVDEHEAPDWFDNAARFDAFGQMRDVLNVAANRTGELLFGGLAFFSQPGSYTTKGTRVTACGGSKVIACGGSEVTAYDGSEVTAYDGSEVTAYDGSEVTAYDGSKVIACGGSEVTAYDGSKVTAYGGSKITAYGGSKITEVDQ